MLLLVGSVSAIAEADPYSGNVLVPNAQTGSADIHALGQDVLVDNTAFYSLPGNKSPAPQHKLLCPAAFRTVSVEVGGIR